eukprot:scaffold28153_cov22-Cyclotella_meneghiniana.AAC.4
MLLSYGWSLRCSGLSQPLTGLIVFIHTGMSDINTSSPIIPGKHGYALHQVFLLSQVSAAIASVASFISIDAIENCMQARQYGAKTVKRVRKNMDDVFFDTGEKRKRGAVPNGPITKAARLSIELMYFSGGDPFDIAEVHGVGDDEVVRSTWDVVDAIHNSPELDITFPETHEEQMDCTMGFKAKSRININCCVGCIDGMMVWTK